MTRLMFLATALMLTGTPALAQLCAGEGSRKATNDCIERKMKEALEAKTPEEHDKAESAFNAADRMSCALNDAKGRPIDYTFKPRGDGKLDEIRVTRGTKVTHHPEGSYPKWFGRLRGIFWISRPSWS